MMKCLTLETMTILGPKIQTFFFQDDSWLLSCFHFVIVFHFSFFFHFSPKKHNGESSSKLFTFKSPLRPCSNFIFKNFTGCVTIYFCIFRFLEFFFVCSNFVRNFLQFSMKCCGRSLLIYAEGNLWEFFRSGQFIEKCLSNLFARNLRLCVF